MVNVIWTETAIEDLKLIHEYISKDLKLYADRFVEKIITRVKQLEISLNPVGLFLSSTLKLLEN
jgi:plasmid stabilization system protein ParE